MTVKKVELPAPSVVKMATEGEKTGAIVVIISNISELDSRKNRAGHALAPQAGWLRPGPELPGRAGSLLGSGLLHPKLLPGHSLQLTGPLQIWAFEQYCTGGKVYDSIL